jgi:hypothetical protein
MNTPAHAVFNLLVLGRKKHPEDLTPIAIGAVLPDMPMVSFYFANKVILGAPEMVIWSQTYYSPGWQIFFDFFNSLPIIALIGLVAWRLGSRWMAMLSASMALHSVCDLLLHNNDAHRHFFPFSNWRFESPISYWDPSHFGLWFAPVEIAMVIVGSFWLLRRYQSRWAKSVFALVAISYAVYIGYVVIVWV